MGTRITTGRTVLEDLTGNDLSDIRRIAGNPEVMRYVLLWLDDDGQVRQYLDHAVEESRSTDRNDYRFAVRIAGTGDMCGFAFLEIDPKLKSTAEAGYILLPEYWNAGYATEILSALLAFGFGDLCLHRVYGKCDDLNPASARVMEKCGLVYEGTLREHVWLRDHWRSTRYYGMLAGEYARHS